jgi:hypothetical protein
VVVGPTGFVGASEPAVVDYIRSTFIDRPKPDLLMTVGGPAAAFRWKPFNGETILSLLGSIARDART